MKSFNIAILSGALLVSTGAMANPPHNGPDARHHQDSSHQSHRGHFKRGQKLTSHYRDRRYTVTNYSQYHLHQPPRGYHWVHDEDNNDFVLAAIATGVIAEVIANQQH